MPVFTSQPQYPAPPSPEWLSDALVGLFSITGAGGLYDAVNRGLSTANTATRIITPEGFKAAYSSGQKTTFANCANYGLAGPMTIIVIADVTALSGYGSLVSCQNDTVSVGWEFRVGFSGSDSRILMHRANAGGYRQFVASASNLISAGDTNNFIAVSCAVNTIETAPTFFNVNGTEYTPGASILGSGTGAATASTSTLNIGARAAGGTSLVGAVSMCAPFNRALTFAETEYIRANPWILYQAPSVRRFWSGTASAAIAVTASNNASATASLIIPVDLSANVASVSTATATLGISAALSVGSTNAATASAALSIAVEPAINSAANSTVTAALDILTILFATASNQSSATADLIGVASGDMAVTAANSATATAALEIATALAVAAINQATATADLIGVAPGDMAITASNSATAIVGLIIGTTLATNTPSISTGTGSLTLEIVLGVQAANQAVASANLIGVTPGAGVYPAVSTVLAGTVYGPTGIEFTGTLTFPTADQIAIAVWSKTLPL